MINQNNLNKMYEVLIDQKELTTKQLNECGFNSKDIAALIEDGTLERVKRGCYSFLSIDNLFYYGKMLISLKKYEKATACFEKCYELNPNHFGVCFQLFTRSVQNREYDKAFEYFERFYNNDNKFYNSDCNYYLYLLSMITELPDNYRQHTKFLKFRDMRVDFDDKRYEDIPVQNKIRSLSFDQKFITASKQLNNLIKQHGKLSIQDIITKELLNQAILEQNRIKEEVIGLVNNKQYLEVINCLESIKERRVLSILDEQILSLTKEILKIIETGIIPKKQIYKTDSFFEAINGKNFDLALSLNSEYINSKNIDPQANTTFILLTHITQLIKSKMPGQENKTNESISPAKEMRQDQVEVSNSPSIMSTKSTMADIINYLMEQDLDNSFRVLRNFLDSIDKRKYETLIIDLIRVSLIENDIAFTRPMIALNYVSRENFTFDVSEYIQKFYETLSQNKFDDCKIYLDIISESNKLGYSCVVMKSLEQVLNTTEKMVSNQKNDTIELSESNSVGDEINDVIKKIGPVKSVAEQDVTEFQIELKDEACYDKKFITSKLVDLSKMGIILLKPMDSERRKQIHSIVNDVPSVVSFSIGSDSARQVVLRYKPYIDKYVDIPKISKEGNVAYKSGDYDLCIEKYRQLLKVGNPRSWVYSKIGLAHMKKNDKDIAIDYLTVATELAKKEHIDCDFKQLIGLLNGSISKEDLKPKFAMDLEDFNNDVNNNYGIENIDKIAEMVASGIGLDEVCDNLKINEEQKNLISLIFARDCYIQENDNLGDQYLKRVEKVKNKSESVCKLFEEVTRNKKFYKNRLNKNYKPLELTKKKEFK